MLLTYFAVSALARQTDSSNSASSGVYVQPANVSGIQSYNLQLRARIVDANLGTRAVTVQSPADAAALIETMTNRQKLFEQLIRLGLGVANPLRLTATERQQFVAALPQAASLIEDDVEISGQAQQLVADDFANHNSQTWWRIGTANGLYRLFFGSQAVPSELQPNLPLKVTGLLSGHSIAVNTASIARPQQTSSSSNAEGMTVVPATSTALACSTTGVQKIAVLMVTTPANPSFPSGWDESFLQNHFFGTSGLGLNTYWQQASYGQTSAAGQVYGPFALSQNYTCGVNDEQLMSDAVTAASSTVNFSQFDRVAVVFPVQSCTYGGLGSVGCGAGLIANQSVSQAWFPIFSFQLTSQFISLSGHEFGHNLGLNHGNSDDYGAIPLGALDVSGINTEYGDNYTVMGADYNVSGEYVGQHKATLLGWLPYGAYSEINASGNYSVSPLENPGGVKTLRIIRNPSTGASLWLEYRQPLGIADPTFEYYSSSQSNIYAGASIHYQDPNLDKLHTYQLDYNPVEVPNDFNLSTLAPGQTWSDPYSLLTLTAQTAGTAGMAVTVSYDQPCATLSFSTSTYSAAGGTGTVQVSAPASCSWTASAADSWINITSGSSGSGNGTVSFGVAASSQPTQRTADITVQRQTVAVLQAGSGSVVIPPGSSTAVQGANGYFSFNVTDASGPGDIATIQFNLSNLANSGCNVLTYGQQYLGNFYLLNDTGTQWIQFTNGSASNSQCTLYSDSSESISGNNITVNLHIQFASTVAGNHTGEAYAYVNSGASYGPYSVGAWQVPYAGAVATMTNEFINFGSGMLGSSSSAQTATLTNTGLSALTIGTISFTGANPSQFNQSNNCPNSLGAGANCTFTIVFQPTASGAQSAVMNISDSANGSPQLIFLQGVGQNSLSASQSSVVFQNQIVNTSSPIQAVTLTNIGSTALTLSSLSITGTNAASFSQTNNCPSQLPRSANCTISIKFNPTSSGTDSAAIGLTYTTQAGGSFPVSIPFLGTGVTTVSAPVFSSVAGTYASALSVTINDATAAASLYYTLNGTTPTSSSTKYSGPITISSTATLEAIAIVSGSSPSPVTTASYKIVNPVAAQTTLTVTPSSAAQGSVFVLQAAVTVNGAALSTGVVKFYGGSILLGNAVVNKSTGVATLKTASLLPGVNQLSATFIQDNLGLGSTSGQVAVTVTGVFPTLATLTNAGTQGNYVLTTSFTAFGAGIPGGTVTFNDTSTGTTVGSASPSGFQTQFTGTNTFAQSKGTQDIALGDVNGDGHLDMVVASYNGTTNWVSVSLGNGDGTFGSSTPITTLSGDSNGGSAVVLADVNGDGKLDILATSWAGYGLAVFLGNGDGTFGAETNYGLDSGYANSIAVGDFNGDGKLDVVTSDPFGNTISVLLGNGDGTFQTEHAFATDTTPEAVTVADFNNDGRLDIAAANTTGTVSMFLGNGDGTFQVLPLMVVSSSGHYQGSKAITAADFNGDGNLDLAVSVWDSQGIGILSGNGDGTFQAVQFHATPGISPTGVQSADINRDGYPDLAVCAYNGSASTVLLNIGKGAFQVNSYPVDNGSASIALGDLNGDGLIDLVTASSTNNTTSPRLAQTSFSATVTSITLPGFNNDNVSATYSGDTKFGSSSSNTLTLPSYSTQTGTPTFNPPGGTYAAAQSVTISDSNSGATIYYTTNGTTPTTSSTKYTGAVSVTSTETLEAIAVAAGTAQSPVATAAYTINTVSAPLQFVPITPCRLADTRNTAGVFGGPELAAGAVRTFNIPSSSCSIPSIAAAYSLNVTVVPDEQLSYLTVWPAGQNQPVVSTLNSDGRIKANAAIVPAGTGGGIDVYATNSTQLVLDIDGYFIPATSSSLEFYSLSPCRVVDTRTGTGSLSGPYLSGGTSRAFPVLSSSCSIPSSAKAYSLNFTAVPHSLLSYITVWPTGQAQPNVSTLNSSTGTVVANAALVPSGSSGEISVYTSDDTDMVIDINGYFAPPASGGLSLYTVSPCRVLDTRNTSGQLNGTLSVGVTSTGCGSLASSAEAFVLNATVVPAGALNFLTLWPNGAAQPNVSTLNAFDATITSNMAIVPTTNGLINAFTSNPSQLILDISGFFAP